MSSTPSTADPSTVRLVHDGSSGNDSPDTACDGAGSRSASPRQGRKHPLAYINTNDAELLLHFVTRTAETFAAGDRPDDPILRFWSRNAPQVALSHGFVMHLIYAISAYHLVALCRDDTDNLWPHRTPDEYLALAQQHMAAGVAACTGELTSPGPQSHNCGALYLAAVLICYCTFAAGPDGPQDLLICRVGPDAALVWRPMVQGVNLIRQVCCNEDLFGGLMSPLAPSTTTGELSSDSALPVCSRPGSVFPRIKWEVALGGLRDLTAAAEPAMKHRDQDACCRALDMLIGIYSATYGRDQDGLYDGDPNNQHVFRWLYCLSQDFVACAQRQDQIALLILAYFAPLLETVGGGWYIRGWRDHLITSIRPLLSEEYLKWLNWPAEQAGIA